MIYYIIPARQGSKGFVNKNRKLLDYTLNVLPTNENVIITTDDTEIIKRCKGYTIIERDSALCDDYTSMREVLLDVVDKCNIKDNDIIVTLYLTYPYRKWKDVENALTFFNHKQGLSLLCKMDVLTNPYLCMYADGVKGSQIINHNLYRRQDYKKVFEISHYISIMRAYELYSLNDNLYNENTIYYHIERTVDVDNEKDMK